MGKLPIQTFNQQVASYVKDAIKKGNLSPGDSINEMELAKELSISQAPVREAMQSLISEGFVTLSKRSKFINTYTPKEIRDSFLVGGALESVVVATGIGHFSDDDIKMLEELVDKMLVLTENKTSLDMDRLEVLDFEFHDLFYSIVENEIARKLMFRSCQILGKFFFHNYKKAIFSDEPKQIYIRHKQILDAIKSRNPKKIENVIRKHWITAGELIAQFVEKNQKT